MIKKTNISKNSFISTINKKIIRHSGLIFLLLLFIISVVYPYYAANNRSLISNAGNRAPNNTTNFQSTKDLFNELDYENTPQKVTIELKEKNYKKLDKKRIEALKAGVLLSAPNDFVQAKIIYNNNKYDAKIRLKGDWTDHLEGEKWSFRIKLANKKTLFGMNKFSIQHPGTRNYINEWLYHKFLKYNDMIALNYNFLNCNLVIKRKRSHNIIKNLGIYAIEEGFDKLLIEHNRLREGVIVKFNEDVMWKERALMGDNRSGLLNSINASHVDVFSRKRVLSDNLLFNQFITAKNLLNSYFSERLTISEVFDVEKFASFIAASNLMGAQHALFWHNLRFYYNPITSRLEPLGFDGDTGKTIKDIQPIIRSSGKFKSNLEFFKYLAFYFEKYSDTNYIDIFLKNVNKELVNNIKVLNTEFPEIKFNAKFLHNNQYMMRNAINPSTSFVAYLEDISDNAVNLKIRSMSDFAIEIINISHKNGAIISQPNEQYLVMPNHTKIFSFKIDEEFNKLFIKKKKGKIGFDLATDYKKIIIKYRTFGTNLERTEMIIPWKEYEDKFVDNDFIRISTNLDDFKFLKVDHENKIISFKRGIHNVNQKLVFPKGYKIIVPEGTKINLIDHSFILSYSPLIFIGTKEHPIFVYSSDKTGQGITVLNSNDKSIFDYVIFENLTNPKANNWELTGALTFYESPVRFNNCVFNKNDSEDYVNVIRTKLNMNKVSFKNTKSDALDGDFITGRIKNANFYNTGNDAIDLSGSKFDLTNISIENTGDKAISAGEQSSIKINNIIINKSEIAIACKDSSKIKATGIKISDSKLGFTAYKKKEEFGPAEIYANKVQLTRIKTPYLIEDNSVAQINGKKIKTTQNVLEKMYGVEYGKSSD